MMLSKEASKILLDHAKWMNDNYCRLEKLEAVIRATPELANHPAVVELLKFTPAS